jgi:hypothetical protein
MLVIDGVDNPAALKTAKALAALLFASKTPAVQFCIWRCYFRAWRRRTQAIKVLRANKGSTNVERNVAGRFAAPPP